jgi:hypothetical protein
MNTKIS